MPAPTRPPNVPAEARWNARDGEWEAGAEKGGRCVGAWTWWRADGKLLSRCTFGKNGELNGPFQRFHPNGEVSLEGSYRNGEPSGVHAWHFCSARTDQSYLYSEILEVGAKVRTVLVDHAHGDEPDDLVRHARFFDAKGVETNRKGVPLSRQPKRAPAAEVPVVAGRDVPRMIQLLFRKRGAAPKRIGGTWIERDLFRDAMRRVDARRVRFLGDPTDEHGTWLLSEGCAFDTMGYHEWLGALAKLLDPSEDFDGVDGALGSCAGYFWVPLCGTVAVAYEQNEGGVDVDMVSGLLAEKTAAVYSWLTPASISGGPTLRFTCGSITDLLCRLTNREDNDPSNVAEGAQPVGRMPTVHFVPAQASRIDPGKRWEGRRKRPGFDPERDADTLFQRARWILAAVDGSPPEVLARRLAEAEALERWEGFRAQRAPAPTSVLYWLLRHAISGDGEALADALEKARRVRGVRILEDLVPLLAKGDLPGFPLEKARQAVRAAGAKRRQPAAPRRGSGRHRRPRVVSGPGGAA